MSVCVIGAGIIGLSTACEVQKKIPNAKFSPNTTGDISAGWWMPYYVSLEHAELVKNWGKITFDHIEDLIRENAQLYGVGYCDGYLLYEKEQTDHSLWKDTVRNYRTLTSGEIHQLGWSDLCEKATFLTSTYLECKRYLPALLERFQKAGGTIEKRKVDSIDEVVGKYDVIVNCSGLGAYFIVNDKTCYPIRGQVYKIAAPDVKTFVARHGIYILINSDEVTLGGTAQKDDWNTEVDPEDSKRIWDGCMKMMPSALKNAQVLREVVGLRPGRPSIRLEKEMWPQAGKEPVPVIHNYGHGGSGVTLFQGCAIDAAQLVAESLSS